MKEDWERVTLPTLPGPAAPARFLTLAHPDPEVVAATHQNLPRACQKRGVRAFVV